MSDTACPLCRGTQTRDVVHVSRHQQTYQLVQCTQCTCTFVSPRPSHAELNNYYSTFGEHGSTAAVVSNVSRDEQVYAERFRKRLRTLAQFTRPPGRLLDVGCALGSFLSAAQAAGWDTTGVEIASSAAEIAQQRSGSTVTVGELANASYETASMDVVTCWHLIEHVLDPIGVLREVRRIVKPTGVVALETPNIASRNFQQQQASWEYLTPPGHINYFNATTLTAALAQCGLRVCSVSYDAGTGVGAALEEHGLGGVRRWGRRHYRWIAPLRELYLQTLGRVMPRQDDMLVVFARPEATS